MATEIKFSEFGPAGPLTGAEEAPILQDGSNVNASLTETSFRIPTIRSIITM
jgi:hypothetical protein